MEWTGAGYADTPTMQVQTWIVAPPERVWAIVTEIELMPSMSTELQSVHWQDGASGPGLGTTFVGRNENPALGEWTRRLSSSSATKRGCSRGRFPTRNSRRPCGVGAQVGNSLIVDETTHQPHNHRNPHLPARVSSEAAGVRGCRRPRVLHPELRPATSDDRNRVTGSRHRVRALPAYPSSVQRGSLSAQRSA